MAFFDKTPGQTLGAAEVDILMRQSVMVFASSAERDSELSDAQAEGMVCYTEDGNILWYSLGADPEDWIQWESPYTTYTPSWTNLTPDTSTVLAARKYQNGCMRITGQITLGGSFSVSGNVSQAIPDGRTCHAYGASGSGLYNDAGVPYGLIIHSAPGATSFNFVYDGSIVNGSIPATPASGDVITWDITIPLVAL